MKDQRYLQNQEKFLDYAFSVFQTYFTDRDEFIRFYEEIGADDKKNEFLRITSFFKFLVKDGMFSFPGNPDGTYIDDTYKFIGLTSLIESLESDRSYQKLEEWLLKKDSNFPFDKKAFKTLLEQYYREMGLRCSARFETPQFTAV